MSDRESPKTSAERTLAGVGAILATSAPAVFVAAALAAGCSVEKPAGEAPPAIVLEDVTLRHYAADGTLRTGTATEVIVHREEGRLEGSNLRIDAPPTADLKRGGVRLEAATGKSDLKGEAATLAGGVTVTTGAGDHGATEAATWDAATETISGDTPVNAEGPGYRTRADGFAFRVPDQQLQLKGDVQIHTDPKEAKQ